MSNIVEEDIVIKDKVPKSRRILAFDLIRGFFLVSIMIDHIELYPNFFSYFTGEGKMWVSAAEGFFFMSGLLIGMMYRRRLAFGMRFIFKKMWKRAVQLYAVGTALTFIFLAWVEFTPASPIKDNLPNPFPWHHEIVQALLMRFTYGWADFLVRFAILMLIAPFVFYVIAKGRWWLAAAGILIAWVFRGQGFTLSWQLLFNAGILFGFYWKQITERFNHLSVGRRRLVKRTTASAAAATFIISYGTVYLLSFLNRHYDSLTPWLRHLTFTANNYNADIWVYAQKWTMGPVRVVLFFLWFTTLYWLVRKYEPRLDRYSFGILKLLGQNSLFVYTVHAFIVFAFWLYLIPANTNWIQGTIITGAGLTLLVLITKFYKNIEPTLPSIRLPRLNPRAGSNRSS